jgi:hypothetical protein
MPRKFIKLAPCSRGVGLLHHIILLIAYRWLFSVAAIKNLHRPIGQLAGLLMVTVTNMTLLHPRTA